VGSTLPPFTLAIEPLTAAGFTPFGGVIDADPARREAMNGGTFERFNDLARVDVDPGRTRVGIARALRATPLPHTFDLVERHPLGSQAFVPLGPFAFVVVVAQPGESVRPEELRAFITDGTQGVNYARGVWHMPLVALEPGQAFLVIDRGEDNPESSPNCDELRLDRPVILVRA